MFCSFIIIDSSSTGRTVTTHVASSPFDVVAFMLAVPTPFAVTVPSVDTVATSSLSEVHDIVLSSVVSTGLYVTSNFSVPPHKIDVLSFIDIEFNGIITFTLHVAVIPFDAVAVITVSPSPTAVTTPSTTVATDVSVDDHFIVLSTSVSVGLNTTSNVNCSERFIVFSVTLSLNDIPFKGTPTVTEHFASIPFAVLAVIVALPFPTAVTTPFSTVATLSALDDHVTVLSPSAFPGKTVAVNVSVSPFSNSNVFLFNDIPVTGCLTITSHLSSFAFEVLAVIVAVPFPTAVIVPSGATVATLLSLDDHVTLCVVASCGSYVTVNFSVSFTHNSVVSLFKLIEFTGCITFMSAF